VLSDKDLIEMLKKSYTMPYRTFLSNLKVCCSIFNSKQKLSISFPISAMGTDPMTKVSIRFRGRQNNYTNLGRKVMDIFLGKLEESASVERAPRLEGNNMFMILAPKK